MYVCMYVMMLVMAVTVFCDIDDVFDLIEAVDQHLGRQCLWMHVWVGWH